MGFYLSADSKSLIKASEPLLVYILNTSSF